MASYQCPDCGQVIPVIGLDDGPPPACPVCHGAVRAGEPSAVPPPPPAADPAAVQPGPPPVEIIPPAPLPEEVPDDLDIRRKDVRLPPAPPVADRPARSGGWRFGWAAVVLGIMVVRVVTGLATRPAPPPLPPPPQFHMQIPPMPPMPPIPVMPPMPPMAPLMPPPQVGQEVLVQAASWQRPLAGADAPRLIVSGPDHPQVGLLTRDEFGDTKDLFVFDGATGAPAGHHQWNERFDLTGASLSPDGRAAAVLVQTHTRDISHHFELYRLPFGAPVRNDWHPYPDATDHPPAALWFSLVAPDRLLTVFRDQTLALWALPEGRQLYAVELPRPVGAAPRRAAISPDRRTVAIADTRAGFVFYDTATGSERGRTAPLKRLDAGDPVLGVFSPDGQSFAAILGDVAPGIARRGLWARWSCPDGKAMASWPVLGARDFLFWDADHVLLGAPAIGARRQLFDAGSGQLVATVAVAAGADVIGDGRRLWYVATERTQPLPQRHLAALALRPDWFDPPAPPGPLFAPPSDWRLTPDGLVRRGP